MITDADVAAAFLRALGYRVYGWGCPNDTRVVSIQVEWFPELWEAARLMSAALPKPAFDTLGGECVIYWPSLLWDGDGDDELKD